MGLDESWREGDTTAAFTLPGTEVELMLDIPPGDGPEWKAGGMFAVESVKVPRRAPSVKLVGEIIDMPGGRGGDVPRPRRQHRPRLRPERR